MMFLSLALVATVAQLEPETVAKPAPTAEQIEGWSDAAAWEERGLRAKDFRAQMMTGRKAQEASHNAEVSVRKKRGEARRDCAERLRKANRDARFSVLLLCLHQDLVSTLETVRRRQESLGSRAGVSVDTSSLIRARGDLLIDALQAVIDAIDAGVYSNEDELREARNNLREKYVLPYHSLLPRSDAEHALAGIAHMLLRSSNLDRSALPEDVIVATDTADTCLKIAEQSIASLEAPLAMDSSHRAAVRNCIAYYRNAQELIRAHTEPATPEESTEPQWQKRSLRRLPSTRN